MCDADHAPASLHPGWRAIPALLATHEIATIRDACHRLLSGADDAMAGDKPHGGTAHLVMLDQRLPVVAEILGRKELLGAVHHFLGSEVETVQVSFRSPGPGYGAQKLHTDDLAKLDAGPDRSATAIVALVDFTPQNGVTRVVPGSHRRPDLQRLAGNLESHPEELLLTGAAGTAFVFSGHLLHSGTRNGSPAARPALQLQWRRC